MSLQSNPLYEKVKERVERLFDVTWRALADSRLTAAEIQEIVRRFLSEANGMVADVDAADGDRQQLFVDLCVAAWTDLGKPIQLLHKIWGLKSLPHWIRGRIEEQIVDPLIRSIVEVGAAVVYRLLSDASAA